jgi:ATP-dependent DNA ligase
VREMEATECRVLRSEDGISTGPTYLTGMLRKLIYQPRIPTRGTEVPTGPDWFHEIKHDGYRLIVQPEGTRVRLLTRRGYDWSDRYPHITQAALLGCGTLIRHRWRSRGARS